MPRYRATLSCDGTAYSGFQRQAGDTPTVQGTLEQAIARVTGQSVALRAAGRTDAGVHAEGQVIAFDVDWRHSDAALLRALNANLPDDIALQTMRQQAGFHPRYDAQARRYRYTIVQAACPQPLLRWSTWQTRRQLDGAVLQQAADLLVGEHDFASFGKPPQGETTVREVFLSRWRWQAQHYGLLFTYHIEANAFLYHMVRRVVALIVEVGSGANSLAAFEADFRRAKLAAASPIAPPQGLVLEAVRYGDE